VCPQPREGPNLSSRKYALALGSRMWGNVCRKKGGQGKVPGQRFNESSSPRDREWITEPLIKLFYIWGVQGREKIGWEAGGFCVLQGTVGLMLGQRGRGMFRTSGRVPMNMISGVQGLNQREGVTCFPWATRRSHKG